MNTKDSVEFDLEIDRLNARNVPVQLYDFLKRLQSQIRKMWAENDTLTLKCRLVGNSEAQKK